MNEDLKNLYFLISFSFDISLRVASLRQKLEVKREGWGCARLGAKLAKISGRMS